MFMIGKIQEKSKHELKEKIPTFEQNNHLMLVTLRKKRKLHLALIFECTFHRLTALASSCFFSQLFCLI